MRLIAAFALFFAVGCSSSSKPSAETMRKVREAATCALRCTGACIAEQVSSSGNEEH